MKFKLKNWLPRFLLVVTIAWCGSRCNPEPPRKPATSKKADPSIPGATSASDAGGSVFVQDGTGDNAGGGQSPSPPSTAATPDTGVTAPGPGTTSTTGNTAPGAGTAPTGGSTTAGNTSAVTPSPASPGGAANPSPPGPVATLNYKIYYKPAEPGVADKRQGGWNLTCVSLKNLAGTSMAGPICNKKISNSCYVFHDTNYGLYSSASSSLIDAGIEINLAVTLGATYCKNGARLANSELQLKDTYGFTYLDSSGAAAQAQVFSSKNNATLERFTCAKKAVTGGFKYKICMEDAAAGYKSDSSIWDHNDYVVVVESSRELTISGVNCTENGPEINLADSTCK